MYRLALLFSLVLLSCGSHESRRIEGAKKTEAGEIREDTTEGGLMLSAISAGDLGKVTSMIESGFPVNSRLAKQRTPLLEAIAWNRRSIAEFLLDKGADPRLTDEDGKDALALADGNINMEQILKPEVRAGLEGELFAAIRAGDANTIKKLLEDSFADPNALESGSGETVLTLSIKLKVNNAFRALFQKRSSSHLELDLNKRNAAGESPLQLARALGLGPVVNYLVKNGAKE